VVEAYDNLGNVTERTHYGIDGNLVRSEDGYAWSRSRYDAYGHVTEEEYFDVDGKAIADEDGSAKVVHVYDARGRRVQTQFLDATGKPVVVHGSGIRVVFAYDNFDRPIAATYFDAEGRIVPTAVRVRGILPGTLAERIGLAVGDVIVSYGGVKVTDEGQFVALIGAAHGPVILTIRRGSQTLSAEIPPTKIGVEILTARADG
jgi:C-terminal processing protease CtpA/Prc